MYSPIGKHPMIKVSWNDAIAYAKWAGKRLQTEKESGWTARGGLKNKKYSWGDDGSLAGKNFRGETTTVLLETTLIMQVLVVKINGKNPQHLSAALSQMATACMIWQVMFGNGARIGTPAIKEQLIHVMVSGLNVSK